MDGWDVVQADVRKLRRKYDRRSDAIRHFLTACYEWKSNNDGLVSATVPVEMFDYLGAVLNEKDDETTPQVP